MSCGVGCRLGWDPALLWLWHWLVATAQIRPLAWLHMPWEPPKKWQKDQKKKKMAILSKAIYRFNAIPIELPMTFSTELEQIIQKFIWNYKRPRIVKEILQKKQQNRQHNSPRLQTILQSYSNQDSVVLTGTKTDTDQWNRIENSETNPGTYGQLIFKKGSKNIK